MSTADKALEEYLAECVAEERRTSLEEQEAFDAGKFEVATQIYAEYMHWVKHANYYRRKIVERDADKPPTKDVVPT